MNTISATLPMPTQIVIDDVGWWNGHNDSATGGPYRTGIDRNHVPADYAAIISLGRQLDMKPQAAFILSEWDKCNILKNVPSCNWMGEGWDNTHWRGPWMDEALDILHQGREHFELTLHGIGHEYWATDSTGVWNFTRAEWHDAQGNMRPEDEVRARLELFQLIMDQHRIGSFPTSFVPCAFLHRYTPDGSVLSSLLQDAGINFLSLPYDDMFGREYIRYGHFDFDAGIMTADRGNDLLPWYAIGQAPRGELIGPICGMHWPNILHQDPARNESIVTEWVNLLQAHGQRIDRVLSRDTASFATQLAHHAVSQCRVEDNSLLVDYSQWLSLPYNHFLDELIVKIQGSRSLEFHVHNAEIAGCETAGDFVYALTLHRLSRNGKIEVHWS